ncbi:restriction endonuclease [Methanothermobacter sp. CaT2]|uniref:Restriction system protein n=1 Tax=Methanothermobacter defluvii TaxID=49339 RepID=A0A371NCD4_9EURY|nr:MULTISPECIES: restriction endonuclease [Methanothermobacter]REE28173.1 restriction system protein [Methanothermobacter defluvii]WBF07553.1 restriction endonuclease [Methanothermobacter thermautotrophicus]BAM70350.1 restriction endonuclease [Methanothermobacter sp. CaT2]
MALPNYKEVMLPLLKLVGDGKEHYIKDVYDELAEEFQLTDEERKRLIPSGKGRFFDNRVNWARTTLKKAGMMESPRRGYIRITPKGLRFLERKPVELDDDFLKQFPDFAAFRGGGKEKPEVKTFTAQWNNHSGEDLTPEESLEYSYQTLRNELAADLLEKIMSCSPEFFEKLVVDLLLKMGYGGSRRDAGKAIGKIGDGGIDGIIKEDKLGLDTIYIQAKRWQDTVSRPEIQKFAGALQGQKARKGVFITTSKFSDKAREYASSIDNRIVLIDGDELAQLMIDHDVGVSKVTSYEIKKIDTDYFSEE